eukprot:scpid23322/ scgid26234/ 
MRPLLHRTPRQTFGIGNGGIHRNERCIAAICHIQHLRSNHFPVSRRQRKYAKKAKSVTSIVDKLIRYLPTPLNVHLGGAHDGYLQLVQAPLARNYILRSIQPRIEI